MELTAKVRGGKYVLYDEDGKCVAEVRYTRLKSREMLVLDGAGETLYSVVKEGDKIKVSGPAGERWDAGQSERRDTERSDCRAAGQSERRDGKCSAGQGMTGRMIYEQDEAGHTLQPSLFRPPMAETLYLDTPWGEIKMMQDQKREFEIFLNQTRAGRMTHMLGLRKKITGVSPELPKEVYGLILGLGMYMLREDDVEIV